MLQSTVNNAQFFFFRRSTFKKLRCLGPLPRWNQPFCHRHRSVSYAKESVVFERRLRFCKAAQEQRVSQFQLHGTIVGL